MKYEDVKVLDSKIIINDYVINDVKPRRRPRQKQRKPFGFKHFEFSRFYALVFALAVGTAVSLGFLIAQAVKYANVLESVKLISTIL